MTELTCFKAYDICGEISVNIDDSIAYRFGRVVAQHLDAKSIVIGDDTSETSPTFVLTALKAFLRGCQRSRNYLAEQSHEISDNPILWAVPQDFSDAVKKSASDSVKSKLADGR
jgi:hypothetical protein